jgi:hypothetical protein
LGKRGEGGWGGGSQRLEREGAAAQGRGDLGEGRLGLGGTSGPDRDPRPNSLTGQLSTPAHETNQHSTILLVNASQKFQTPKAHHPKEKQKTKKE